MNGQERIADRIYVALTRSKSAGAIAEEVIAEISAMTPSQLADILPEGEVERASCGLHVRAVSGWRA